MLKRRIDVVKVHSKSHKMFNTTGNLHLYLRVTTILNVISIALRINFGYSISVRETHLLWPIIPGRVRRRIIFKLLTL